MIKRIVKLTFEPHLVTTFLDDVFEPSKTHIRAFPGCLSMELLKDINTPNVLFTLSYWQSPEDLEAYRHSELFKATWAKTKVLFAGKAEAWSLEVVDSTSKL
jgi:heme-degrading monooxygenase HmoA